MRHFTRVTFVAFALTFLGFSQTPPAGTIIEARLVRGIDSTKTKAGDAIEAETTWPVQGPSGAVVIPKGSRLLGRVTAASGSSLGLVFDSVRLRDGSQSALDATIQGAQATLRTEDVPYYDPTWTRSPDSPDATTRLPESLTRTVSIERVSAKRDGNVTLLQSTNKNLILPKRARLILLIGSLEELCREKGTARVKPRISQWPALASAGGPRLRLTVVVDHHQFLGCAYTPDAWVDLTNYTKD